MLYGWGVILVRREQREGRKVKRISTAASVVVSYTVYINERAACRCNVLILGEYIETGAQLLRTTQSVGSFLPPVHGSNPPDLICV